MMTAASRPPRARRIGRYVLGRRIGAGGMAAVFAARQTGPLGLGRLVALKVMSSALLGDEALEQLFVREAGISARLQHDNIVRVYEVDEDDTTYFIAMELVVGAPLREIGKTVLPPLPVTLTIISQIADALDYAHDLRSPSGDALDIVHQDVSPHNVMVTYAGVAKLLDFGVARIGHLDASRTETVRGKPAYLAPEQLLGERIDRRTDVFALGIIMHELLSGQRLFRASNDISTYDAVLSKEIPRPEVPDAFADVCMRALRRRPDERFASAGALGQALRDAARQCDLHPATREELAAWVTSSCPPKWSLAELERETVAEEARSGRLEAVQDLPTRSVVPSPQTPSLTTVTRGSTLPLWLAAVALGVGGVAAWAVSHASDDRQVSGMEASSTTALPAAPEALSPPRQESPALRGSAEVHSNREEATAQTASAQTTSAQTASAQTASAQIASAQTTSAQTASAQTASAQTASAQTTSASGTNPPAPPRQAPPSATTSPHQPSPPSPPVPRPRTPAPPPTDHGIPSQRD